LLGKRLGAGAGVLDEADKAGRRVIHNAVIRQDGQTVTPEPSPDDPQPSNRSERADCLATPTHRPMVSASRRPSEDPGPR
jgi:hypothetical protein